MSFNDDDAQAARLRSLIENDTHLDEAGCLRWNMGNAVPAATYRDAYGEDMPEMMLAAYKRCTAASIERYRKARANRTPEQRAEEAFERRAAFGPGVELVDVLTGERIRT